MKKYIAIIIGSEFGVIYVEAKNKAEALEELANYGHCNVDILEEIIDTLQAVKIRCDYQNVYDVKITAWRPRSK